MDSIPTLPMATIIPTELMAGWPRGLTLAVAAPAVAVAVLLAACGGGDTPRSTPTVARPSPTASATPPSASPTPLAGTLDLATESALVTVYGIDGGDFSNGFSTLAVGDFNDDGKPDLLIGAPFADGPDNAREDAGEAYVVYGRDQWPPTLDLAGGERAVTIYGVSGGDNLGTMVLAADINGDGVDDVIVGAPGVTAGADLRTDQGRVYVFFGSPKLKGELDLKQDPQNFVVTGAEGFSRLGQAVASGDVNDDGIADLIMGAPFAGREPGTPPGSPRTEAGEMYVVLGSRSLSGEVATTFGEYDFAATGSQRLGQFGIAVAAGDVNGDGVADIVVGSPQADPNGKRDSAGAVYVFLGHSGLSGRLFIKKEEQDSMILGAHTGDSLGYPLAVADLDGDGIDDIVAGARSGGDPKGAGQTSGSAVVLFGRRDLNDTIDLASKAPGAVLYGAGPSDLIPASLSLSDFTGDGLPDILLSTVTGPQDRRSAGAVYIVAGGAALSGSLPLGTSAVFGVMGAQEDDQLGAALAPLPSADGATPEFFVLASGADGPGDARPDSGEILLIKVRPPP